jgi:hypothetical protein
VERAPLAERQTVLLLPLEGRLDDLSGRLVVVHYRGKLAPTPTDAARLLRVESPPIRAALIPSQPGVSDLPGALSALRDAAPGRTLYFVAVGPSPTASEREKLRSAAVDYVLSDGFTDTELRFVLNRCCYDDGKRDRREDLRAPTPLVGKVNTPMGIKVALVYNLSAGGAYLETMRPSQQGVRVTLELPLPSGTLELPAVVMSTNVTGNLRRDNLPRGMGVRFDHPSADSEAAVLYYVEERLAALRP